MLSMVTHSLAGVSMASVSMAGKDEADDIVFYDRLIGDGKAFIDTGFLVRDNLFIEAEGYTDSAEAYVYGVKDKTWGNSSMDCYLIFKAASMTASYVCKDSGNLNERVNDFSVRTEIISKSRYVFVNDKRISIYYGASYSTKATLDTLALFTTKLTKGNGYSKSIMKGYYRYFRLRDMSQNLVCDFRPVTYKGEAGMYDVVNEVFYGNANTEGSFSVAND